MFEARVTISSAKMMRAYILSVKTGMVRRRQIQELIGREGESAELVDVLPARGRRQDDTRVSRRAPESAAVTFTKTENMKV